MEGSDKHPRSQSRNAGDNFGARWSPEPSFIEDYRRDSQNSSQNRTFPSLHSRPLAHYYNLPNSLESSYDTTTAKKEDDYGYDESSFFDANLMLDPPYRTLDAPPRFGVTQEHYRRRYTPFPRLQTPPQQQPSPVRRRMSTDSLFDTRPNTPHSRSHNAFVDLTDDSPVMRPSERLAQANYNISDGEPPDGPSAKRRKTKGGVKEEIEEVDLRDVDDDNDLARVLEEQRLATVRAQQAEADKPTKLANVTCVVCMDDITNITATHCGTSHHPLIHASIFLSFPQAMYSVTHA